MGLEGTNAELCRTLKEQLVDARREAAEAWRDRDAWYDKADELACALAEKSRQLAQAKDDVRLALWACEKLDDLTRDELAVMVEACLGKWG